MIQVQINDLDKKFEDIKDGYVVQVLGNGYLKFIYIWDNSKVVHLGTFKHTSKSSYIKMYKKNGIRTSVRLSQICKYIGEEFIIGNEDKGDI